MAMPDSLENQQPYADTFGSYWAAGWRGVLPLPPRAKWAPPTGFTGSGPDPSYADCTAWSEDQPDGNIGLRLPDGVIGVDVDAYGTKAGSATMAKAVAELGELPATWRSTSRAGHDSVSGIYLFRVPPHQRWRTLLDGSEGGVEIIQPHHRYAVVWPSIHPGDAHTEPGSLYEWVLPHGAVGGLAAIPQIASLPWLPQPWVENLSVESPSTAGLGYLPPVADGEALDFVTSHRGQDPVCDAMRGGLTWLGTIARAGHDGSLHDVTRDATWNVLRLVAEGHAGGSGVLSELKDAFMAARTLRGDQAALRKAPRDWDDYIRRGVAKLAEVDVPDGCDCFGGGNGPVSAPAITAALERLAMQAGSPLVSAPPPMEVEPLPGSVDADTQALMSKYEHLYLDTEGLNLIPEPDSMIEGILDRHSLVVLSGRDQSFKSFVALDWSLCLATGQPWQGQFATQRTKVLYVVGEGAHGIKLRVAAWTAAHNTSVGSEWFTVRRAPVNLFRQREDVAELAARARVGGYGLIVFDTLRRCSSGADNNGEKDAGVIISSLDRIKEHMTDGSVLLVAHTGKEDRDVRGSSVFEDDADMVWRMRRDAEQQEKATAELTKRKDGPDGRVVHLQMRAVQGTESIVLEPPGLSGLTFQRHQPRHAEEVMRMMATPVFSDGAAASALSEALGHASKSSVINVLNYLIDTDNASKTQLGRIVRYKLSVQGLSMIAKLQA